MNELMGVWIETGAGQGRETTGATEGGEGVPRAHELNYIYHVGKEKLFLCPLRFSSEGGVLIKLTKDRLTREKAHNFY